MVVWLTFLQHDAAENCPGEELEAMELHLEASMDYARYF